jgi:hypothetical protein
MEKLESLLVDAVNEADNLAGETEVLIHRVRLRNIRDELDNVLGRVQRMRREAAEAAERERSGE